MKKRKIYNTWPNIIYDCTFVNRKIIISIDISNKKIPKLVIRFCFLPLLSSCSAPLLAHFYLNSLMSL